MSGERRDYDDVQRGLAMRQLRVALGFKTQDSLAQAAGIERVQINKIETGWDKLTSPEKNGKLAEALGISVGELVDYCAGKLTVEEIVTRRASGVAPQRWVEMPDRYPHLGEAIRELQSEGVVVDVDTAREVANSFQLLHDTDLAVSQWKAIVRPHLTRRVAARNVLVDEIRKLVGVPLESDPDAEPKLKKRKSAT